MANAAPVLDFLPKGFRFRPTDEELVDHYLTNKLMGEIFVNQIIPEIDVCKHEPWDIPALSLIQSDDPEWFFFSPRGYKYSNSTRSNRTTLHGFWKATGNDREIKVRGTNDVIGTKKTLVFYKGRVPRGVKTNWVIHEYNAVLFPADQRTFVLCKLMKKPEKIAEERTNELVCDEGEPSSHMASDYENQVHPLAAVNLDSLLQTQLQADEFDFNLTQQSPIVNEQEFSFQFSPLPNSYIGNDNSSGHFPLGTTEEEDDEFVNSLFDEDAFCSEEMRHAFVNDSTPSESLRMMYYGSSDTDTEGVSARYGYIPDTSTVSNKNAGSRESRLMKMVISSHGAEHVGTSQLSSNQEANREKKGRFFQDDFDTSSSDSTTARPFKINCIEIASSPSTLKTCKTQYQPRSANSVSQRTGERRSQTQRKVSAKAAYHHEAQKEIFLESNSSQRKAQVTISRNTLEAPSNQSSDVNGRGSFIHLETPLSQNLSPPSVYLINVVIGFFLFLVIVWQMLSCGRFW